MVFMVKERVVKRGRKIDSSNPDDFIENGRKHYHHSCLAVGSKGILCSKDFRLVEEHYQVLDKLNVGIEFMDL